MRREGWEVRLAALIDAARSKPYALGEHDCLRMACAVVESLTGVDHWPRFAGRYRTRRGARLVIRQIAPSLSEAVSIVVGVSPQQMTVAQRGDIALYREPADEHLGVSLGHCVAVLGPAGLQFVRPGDCAHCWRIE